MMGKVNLLQQLTQRRIMLESYLNRPATDRKTVGRKITKAR